MSKIQLPKLLNIPAKLLPIISKFNQFRYFLIEGGRGSGKSQSIARTILYIGDKNKVRVVCGREIQASIEESVYALFVDIIRENNLNYEIYSSKIIHRTTGTTIRFRGFREYGSINIKGLEGIDILFIDESQALTKQTLKILIPTIRKEKAKIFFVMNRFVEDDPAFKQFHERDDCLHIHIDYFENQHCTEALKREAAECKAINTEDYTHIWLGQPMRQASNAAFRNVMGIVDYNLYTPIDPMQEFTYVMGADLAKSIDYTVLVVLCIQTKEVVYFERMENENRSSWNYQKEKILAVSKMYNNAMVVPDSSGVGDPITEDLQRMGCNVFVDTTGDRNPKEVAGFKFTSVSKENLVEKLKVAIELQLIKIPFIQVLVNELIKFEVKKTAGGRTTYAAPEGKDEEGNAVHHDDCVVGLALALWGSRAMIYDPEYAAEVQKTPGDKFWGRVRKDLKRKEIQKNDGQGMVEYGINDISGDEVFISDG